MEKQLTIILKIGKVIITKAARFYEVGKPLKIENIDIPKIGPDEALIKIKACGVCRTDIHFIYEGLLKPGKIPQTMGHEASGDVVEVGKNVRGINLGDKVLIHFYMSCGECHFCRTGRENLCINLQHFGFNTDGGYAEYAKAKARALVKLPDELAYDACILVDSGTTAYHAVRNVAKVQVGDTIAVIGAGGVGLNTIQIAKLNGANVIALDISEEKLKFAKDAGADITINSKQENIMEEVMKRTAGQGLDVIFDFVGKTETMDTDITMLRADGKLIFIGYSDDQFKVNPLILIGKQLSVIGSRAGSREELVEVVKLAKAGKIALKVTRSFSLDNVNQALDLLRRGEIIGRSIIKP